MAETGKLEKMLILAFSDSEKAENGGVNDADDSFEALINTTIFSFLGIRKSQDQHFFKFSCFSHHLSVLL